jgi:hypothetical protein
VFQSRRTALRFSHGPDSIHTEGQHRFPMTKKRTPYHTLSMTCLSPYFMVMHKDKVDESGTTSTITGWRTDQSCHLTLTYCEHQENKSICTQNQCTNKRTVKLPINAGSVGTVAISTAGSYSVPTMVAIFTVGSDRYCSLPHLDRQWNFFSPPVCKCIAHWVTNTVHLNGHLAYLNTM